MFRYFVGALAALSIFGSTLCFAAATATPQLVQALMSKSGVTKQVEQMPLLVMYGIDQAFLHSQPSLSPDMYVKLKHAAVSSFRAAPILVKIQQNIENKFNKYDIEAILQWLTSPLGEKITKLEESASSPSAYESMQSMKEELLKDTGRVKKMRKLDAAIKATESSVDMAMNTQIAIASSMATALNPDDPTLNDKIVKSSMAGRKQLESDVRDKTLVSLLYTYRTLKDGEIDKYIDFASSDLGRRYQEVITDGMNSGFISASRDFGKLFVQTLRDN